MTTSAPKPRTSDAEAGERHRRPPPVHRRTPSMRRSRPPRRRELLTFCPRVGRCGKKGAMRRLCLLLLTLDLLACGSNSSKHADGGADAAGGAVPTGGGGGAAGAGGTGGTVDAAHLGDT